RDEEEQIEEQDNQIGKVLDVTIDDEYSGEEAEASTDAPENNEAEEQEQSNESNGTVGRFSRRSSD
ncbi:MAG: hypothetical protein FWC09_11490, partial [Lachnospiraceae bacterium]|nr:hypothetical protein [Lachnospiraceae bacterium]